MSIRLLARDLYRAQNEVQRLEDAREAAPMDQHHAIDDELRKARAHMQLLQRALDGQIGR